jgi:hypothetical protein
LTQQEKRLFQDLDWTTDRHSNGLSTKEEPWNTQQTEQPASTQN